MNPTLERAAREAGSRPTTISVPSPGVVSWPEHIAPAVDHYRETHAGWTRALAQLIEAQHVAEHAPAVDEAARLEALAQDKRPPAPTAPAALDECDRAVIRCAAAREAATAATDALKGAFNRDPAALALILLDGAAAALDEYEQRLGELRHAADEAHRAMRQRFEALSVAVRPLQGIGLSLGGTPAHAPERPQWPSPADIASKRGALRQFRELIAAAGQRAAGQHAAEDKRSA